jgi:MFS family permease
MDSKWVALGIYRILLGLKAGALWVFLPLLLLNLGGSFTEINLSLSIPAAIALIFLPFLGYYSDRVGQRKIIFVAELVSIILFLILADVSDPIIVLLLVSIADGAMKITHPLALAGISKSKRKGRALGILQTLGDLSGIGGVALGTAAVAFGYPTLMAGLGAVSLFACITSLFIPESISKLKRKFKIELPKVFTWSLIAAILWVGSGAMVERLWNPLTANFATDVEIGFLAIAIGVTLVGANVSGGILLDRYHKIAAEIFMLIDALILFLAPITPGFLQIGIIRLFRVVPYAVQGIFAQKTALDITKEEFGLSIGTTGALVLLAKAFFPLIGGIVGDLGGYVGVYWLAALVSLGAFLVLKYY